MTTFPVCADFVGHVEEGAPFPPTAVQVDLQLQPDPQTSRPHHATPTYCSAVRFRLVTTCVDAEDHDTVLEALHDHVARMSQADANRNVRSP